jgi:Coenzyme PQQ synthesis protein D (PqqD)
MRCLRNSGGDSKLAGACTARMGTGERQVSDSIQQNDRSGQEPSRIRRLEATTDVVGQRLGDETVLVNLQTNRIFELSRTAGRFWELLQEENDRDRIQQRLVEEFQVSEDEVSGEVDRLISHLAEEQLIRVLERD